MANNGISDFRLIVATDGRNIGTHQLEACLLHIHRQLVDATEERTLLFSTLDQNYPVIRDTARRLGWRGLSYAPPSDASSSLAATFRINERMAVRAAACAVFWDGRCAKLKHLLGAVLFRHLPVWEWSIDDLSRPVILHPSAASGAHLIGK